MNIRNEDNPNGTLGNLAKDDLIDAVALLKDVSLNDEPHSRLLRERLAKAKLIPLPDLATDDPIKFKEFVLNELNALLGGDPFYTDGQFALVKLSAYTRKLLRKNPTGQKLISLHKCLLLDAFPKHFRRRPGRAKCLDQKLAKVRPLKGGNFGVFVDLISPREIEGKVRVGRQKFERQTVELANSLCVEINNLLTNKKLARSLTPDEIGKAERFFWVSLEPNHPEWVDHLSEIVAHCEKTDFRIANGSLPLISEAVRIFWKEHVLKLTHESMLNYRQIFAFLLPAFGHLRTNEMTDQMILKLAHGNDKLVFLATSYKQGQTTEEAFARLWDTRTISDSKRPWDYHTRIRFLSLTRAFKNWMHSSEDPATQLQRNWCNGSTIKLKKMKPSPQTEISTLEDDSIRGNDPECKSNPALTIAQTQALIDVAWVAYDGLYAPFYVHTLWCGTRVKETRKTNITALDLEDGVLSVPPTVDKTKRGREVEVYPNVIVMAPALREAGLYTARGLRAMPDPRALIQILAGFTSGSKKRIQMAENERNRLASIGIELPHYNWGIPFPRNALRRTALSMHYKLFFNVARTTLWGGNSPGIFKEYYKRLVTKAEAREYWVMLPTWLKAKHPFQIDLPKDHKLDSALSDHLQAAANEARTAMKMFLADIRGTKEKIKQQKYEKSLERARERAAAYRKMKKSMSAQLPEQPGISHQQLITSDAQIESDQTLVPEDQQVGTGDLTPV